MLKQANIRKRAQVLLFVVAAIGSLWACSGQVSAGVSSGGKSQKIRIGYFANVIEAQVADDGSVRVVKVWVAGDVGRQIVNPSGALAQVQGSVLDALGAATGQAITFADGAVEQRNFGDYPLLRMDAAPPVEVAFITSDYPVTGMGEPAYPAVAPAMANAIFAATGVRLRTLPFDTTALKA